MVSSRCGGITTMATNNAGRGWRDVLKVVASPVEDSELPFCPTCGQQRVDYMYIGDAETRIGYLVIWCPACLHGVRMSRVRAPAGVHFMTFTDPDDAFVARVPTFTEIPLPSLETGST